jgi:hypothetical protein
MLGRAGVVGALAAAAVLLGPALATAAPKLPTQDQFYSYSGSLAGVAPGAVLKTRSITLQGSPLSVALTASQVLYRTTGELGQPTVTVATIIRPLLPLATKIVSYQTAYDALGAVCDPSYTLQGGNPGYATAVAEDQLLSAYVLAGNTVVVPDYEGVNLDWGAGQESGYSTLDGIRAAESSLQLPASTPVGMVGYSGGSIATEFASELAPTYSPSLNVVGAAEGGVPVDFAHNLRYINGSQGWSGVIPAVLVGVGRAFKIPIAQYESAYGRKIAAQVSDKCINDFFGNYPGLKVEQLVRPAYANFLAVPLFARITNQLIMSTAGTPKAPLFIGVGNADGTGDGVMVANDVEALAYTYCQRGASVQFNEYKGDDHTGAAIPFEAGALTFLTQLLNGGSVANGCGSIGPGNSLAPLPVAAVKLRYIGPRRRARGVLLYVRTTTGTLNGLVLKLWRRGRVVDTQSLPGITTSAHRLVLRVRGRMPKAGRYRLVVSQATTALGTRKFRLR